MTAKPYHLDGQPYTDFPNKCEHGDSGVGVWGSTGEPPNVAPADPDRACEHETWQVDADVNRLKVAEGEPVTGYSIDLRARCLECGTPFVFRGPVGLSQAEARTNVDGTEIRLPGRPLDAPDDFGLHLPGFDMRIIEHPPEEGPTP